MPPRARRYSDEGDPVRDAQEIEANLFAMELLMPAAWLRADVPVLLSAWDGPTIKRLADRYKVEVTLMTMRLMDLGLLR